MNKNPHLTSLHRPLPKLNYRPMYSLKLIAGRTVCLSALLVLGTAAAQPLPKVELRPVLTALNIDKPVWMEEAPDGSGRLFVVEQDGRIDTVPKGSDGSAAKEFLNIVDRKPHFNLEDGLLGFAFHPGFKTNGLFYVDYTLQNAPNQRQQPLNRL